VIRGAVLHFPSEQPLVCDLRALPSPADSAILVTNLHYVDGRKPSFIDHEDSWFLFPVSYVRFIEIPSAAVAAATEYPALPAGEPLERPADEQVEDDDDPLDDLDESIFGEELLRKIAEA
jgi:hypothetical protein